MRFWIGFLVIISGIVTAAVLRPHDPRLALILGVGLILIGGGIQIWCFYEQWRFQRKMFAKHKENLAHLEDLSRRAEEATTDEERIAIIHELCDTDPDAAKMLKGFLDTLGEK